MSNEDIPIIIVLLSKEKSCSKNNVKQTVWCGVFILTTILSGVNINLDSVSTELAALYLTGINCNLHSEFKSIYRDRAIVIRTKYIIPKFKYEIARRHFIII